MRKVMLLILALLTVAGAIGTSIPAAEAVGGGGGTPNCHWTCTCTGAAVCQCAPGTTGFCSDPPIGCAQIITC
jgi:hypothetical protein